MTKIIDKNDLQIIESTVLKDYHAAVHIRVNKKTGQIFSESAWRVAGAVSNNDFQISNLPNQTKIDVIKDSSFSERESEDDILCEMELGWSWSIMWYYW